MSQSERSAQAVREPIRGCLIEMDYVALGGVPRIYDACAAQLATQGVTLNAGLFSRYLLGHSLEAGLNRLLAAQGKPAGLGGDMGREVQGAFLTSLAAAAESLDRRVVALAGELAGRNIRVGLLTRLSEETARSVYAPVLALSGPTLLLPEGHGVVGGFGWDVWRRAIRKMQMEERLCAALTASGYSSKTALAAGLTVITVPAELAAHQDYSGVDFVAEGWSGEVTRAILTALRLAD